MTEEYDEKLHDMQILALMKLSDSLRETIKELNMYVNWLEPKGYRTVDGKLVKSGGGSVTPIDTANKISEAAARIIDLAQKAKKYGEKIL